MKSAVWEESVSKPAYSSQHFQNIFSNNRQADF